MAYATGTATSHKDLLARLVTFLTTDAALLAESPSQAWTVERYLTPSDNEHEAILRGPGLAGTDAVRIGIQTYTYAAGPHYSWRMNGYTAYDSLQSFFNQPGALPSTADLPSIILRNGTINYTFIANGRRVIIITQSGTYYQQAYLGLALPFGPASFNPYPLFIGGNTCQYAQPVDYVSTSYAGSFWNPREVLTTSNLSHAYFYSGGWNPVLNFANTQTSGGSLYASYAAGFINVWPFAWPFTGTQFFPYLRENIDGTYPVLPVVLYKTPIGVVSAVATGAYCALDGVYATFDFALSNGDAVNVGARTFLAAKGVESSDLRAVLIERK